MLRAAAVLFAALTLCARPAVANERSRALISQAFELAYNLDHDEAIATLKQAIAADPKDPATYRGLATVMWLNIAFRRGSVTVDDYLGNVTKSDVKMLPPPPDLAAIFYEHVNKALSLAEARVAVRPNDADAHYQVGAAVGLLASYAATIEGKVLQGFRAARRAFNAHERVFQLDARRKDAGLIVGTYRYIVSTLSLPVRWMAYAVGFGGGRDHGLRLIQEAAAYRSESQTDAKFALILIYNRERRYDEALGMIRDLQQRYPRNRLLWLEGGATAVRARRFAEAEATLAQGMAMLAKDRRPRMFGELALWKFKSGAALLGLRRVPEAERLVREAANEPQLKSWVRGRIHAEQGKLADLTGNRARAREHYRLAERIARDNSDPLGQREASRLLAEGYKQD